MFNLIFCHNFSPADWYPTKTTSQYERFRHFAPRQPGHVSTHSFITANCSAAIVIVSIRSILSWYSLPNISPCSVYCGPHCINQYTYWLYCRFHLITRGVVQPCHDVVTNRMHVQCFVIMPGYLKNNRFITTKWNCLSALAMLLTIKWYLISKVVIVK